MGVLCRAAYDHTIHACGCQCAQQTVQILEFVFKTLCALAVSVAFTSAGHRRYSKQPSGPSFLVSFTPLGDDKSEGEEGLAG